AAARRRHGGRHHGVRPPGQRRGGLAHRRPDPGERRPGRGVRARHLGSRQHGEAAAGGGPLARPVGEGGRAMTPTNDVVFLVDVDNTLLDTDRIQADIKRHLAAQFGADCRDRYWAILEQLFVELGYRDYLGALQRYRVEHPRDARLLSMSSYL